MPNSCPVEFRKDIIGERWYASRNHNDLCHTYRSQGANRASVDWNLTLRQHPTQAVKKGSQSLPELHTAERHEGRKREPLVSEHEDGPYHGTTQTIEKYQNFANTSHFLTKMTRVSSGDSAGVDWMVNLREGLHSRPEDIILRKDKPPSDGWRRYFTRPQQSFDMMKENCAKDNDLYQKSKTTPQDRRPDRLSNAIAISTMRDDKMSFRRFAGCEGTNVQQWRHLIEDRQHGHKGKRQLQHETTHREYPGDPNGAKIKDNRSEGCITEMLGKKKWFGHVSYEPLAARPPAGDPKLHHLSRRFIHSEADEDNRKIRMSKHPRTDDNITEEHQTKAALQTE